MLQLVVQHHLPESAPDVILLASCGQISVELKLSDACSFPLYELQACAVWPRSVKGSALLQ